MKETSTSQPKLTLTSAPTTSPTTTNTPFSNLFPHYGETLTDVPYCTADPAQVMDLYFPAAGGPWYTLMYVHGGSWMHGDKSEAALFAHGMTSLGYLVVSINYRLYPPHTYPVSVTVVKVPKNAT